MAAVYSIKDLEKLSGIKAHTIRAWEQRYGLIKPKRTPTNIRYYLDADLKKLLNIAFLNKNGFKISKIAKMSEEEVAQKISELSDFSTEDASQLDALTISMIEMDEYKFNKIIQTNIKQLGFEPTMLKVIYPLLDKISMLWMTGSIQPVQENFVSYLIRQKVMAAIDQEVFTPKKNTKKFLLFLPLGEKQELSMLFLHFLIKTRHHKVVNLGLETSLKDVQDAYRIFQPDYVFTMITETFTDSPVQPYIDSLSQLLPTSTVLLSGYQIMVQNIVSQGNVLILNSLNDTINFLEKK